jgi:hypothetical protein
MKPLRLIDVAELRLFGDRVGGWHGRSIGSRSGWLVTA